MDPAGIPALQDAIRHLHGVESTHVETAHVREVHEGLLVWEGDIEVFQLEKHPKAKKAYAWRSPRITRAQRSTRPSTGTFTTIMMTASRGGRFSRDTRR